MSYELRALRLDLPVLWEALGGASSTTLKDR
jgi:hypothetical protein